MPLTDSQRNALSAIRAYTKTAIASSGTAESADKRAQLRDPARVPADVTVRVEIAPPSPHPPPPPLDGIALRAPERVPVFFFALQSDQPEPDVANTHVIFFVHGGANIHGHPTEAPYIHLFAQLLRAAAERSGDASRCILVAPSFRLAAVPENAFPAALQDLVAAYDHVLGKGYKASNTVVAGDSSGGNQVVVLTHLVLKSGRPSPHGVVAIAPSAIWAYDQFSDHAKALADGDVIDISNTDRLASAYVGDSGVPSTHPLVSGVFIPFDASWPKTLILVGTSDQLIDSSHGLKKRLTDIKRPVELVEYDERPHAWWSLSHLFPEDIQDAVQRIASLVLQ